jgi:hypothetical protein
VKTAILSASVLAAALFLGAPTQETPQPMVSCYSSMADAILALKSTEAEFVRSLLDGHLHAASAHAKRGDGARAAAEMALFANEGDNAIGGVRKRLVEGGHHHNAAGEAKGIYEAGFVIVTREAKKKALDAAAQMRQAETEEQRAQAWAEFESVAQELIRSK